MKEGLYHMGDQKKTAKKPKIGLALSGGGFRAAIFHLGVIRRLEELGIMPKVDVISSVSGGSIVAAYYVSEMERRLRAERSNRNPNRIKIFEDIATDFFRAINNNLRNRSLLFAPFYHPVDAVRNVVSLKDRSNLVQKDLDRWFFHGNTLDQLPSVTWSENTDPEIEHLAGPKLLINTTSLLSGERVTFSRQTSSSINQLFSSNNNNLPLSLIVAASAGVPGAFPTTQIAGDMLIDGGVSDNQGLEALLEEDCDVLLVSDAAGNMDKVNTFKPSLFSVLCRTNRILQFQVRRKVLEKLSNWDKEFAFVHLLDNEKGKSEHRVPTEYIQSLAGLRTDLDQFSYIEQETLMYHGYTLIDAKLKRHCPELLKLATNQDAEVLVPPIFQEEEKELTKHRQMIRTELETGQDRFSVRRAYRKHGWKVGSVVGATFLAPMGAAVYSFFQNNQAIEQFVQDKIVTWSSQIIPKFLSDLVTSLEGYIQSPISLKAFTGLLAFTLLSYILMFVTSSTVQTFAKFFDRRKYKKMAKGTTPSVQWQPPSAPEEEKAVTEEKEKETVKA